MLGEILSGDREAGGQEKSATKWLGFSAQFPAEKYARRNREGGVSFTPFTYLTICRLACAMRVATGVSPAIA